MVEEGFDGAGNDAGQSAGWGDEAFVVIAHAFDNLHRLKMAHDCADIDVFRIVCQAQTAAFAVRYMAGSLDIFIICQKRSTWRGAV